MNRIQRIAATFDTISTLKDRYYLDEFEQRVDLQVMLDYSIQYKVEYLAEFADLFEEEFEQHQANSEAVNTQIHAINTDFLSFASDFVIQKLKHLTVINFTNAEDLGGEVKFGGKSFDHLLLYSSGLYNVLEFSTSFYQQSPSDTQIMYLPKIPFFKNTEGDKIPLPYPVHCIVAPQLEGKAHIDMMHQTLKIAFLHQSKNLAIEKTPEMEQLVEEYFPNCFENIFWIAPIG